MRYTPAIAAALISLGASANAQTTLPTVDLYDLPIQQFATLDRADDLFNAICVVPDGNATNAFSAMSRADFVEINGAFSGKYAAPDVQVAFDLTLEGDTYTTCSMRWVTTEPMTAMVHQLASYQSSAPGTASVGIIRVDPMDGTTTNLQDIPARANGDELKVIVAFWASPL